MKGIKGWVGSINPKKSISRIKWKNILFDNENHHDAH